MYINEHLKKVYRKIVDDNLNIGLRSEILVYSLNTENKVNSLLLSCLAIFDKQRTKNFGNKAGISFKSKIDLLFDLNILSKEEHFNLELQMVFRNKFLHDLDFNSFTYAISKLENSIVNKLKKMIIVEGKNYTEEDYRAAYSKLYSNNREVLSKKFDDNIGEVKKKSSLIIGLIDSIGTTTTLSLDLLKNIFEILENSNLENPEISKLSEKILTVCNQYSLEIESNAILKKNLQSLQETTTKEIFNLLK